MIPRVAVIGSGPSGTTAARVLIDAGINVDMYDVGTDASYRDQDLTPQQKEGIIPKKTLFGLSFMYRRRDGARMTMSENTNFDTSHAKGGLSTVWGATVGATTAHDILDWPVSIDEISTHLERVFKYMNLSAREDMIDDIYPIKVKGSNLPYENHQSKFILDQAERNFSQLINAGILIGKAKLAVDSMLGSEKTCILCGKCMTGCEVGSIFNSWNTVSLLKEDEKFRYFEHRLVRRFRERNKVVELFFSTLPDESESMESYDAVILAAGCIDSTKIVDCSLGWTGNEYQIKDSQKFYFPVWVGKGFRGSTNESISLAHLYVQDFDAKGNVIQCQLYPGKPIAHMIFEHLFGRFGQVIGRLFSPFLNRCMVGVVYFSSAVSGRIPIRFGGGNQIFAGGNENQASTKEFNTFIGKLINLRNLTGFSPFFYLKLKSKLGHSQHFGGTIPMKAKPAKYESDSLGRPFGCSRVFVVDSAVLPSVPATPTTGLVMANASRISEWVAKNLA